MQELRVELCEKLPQIDRNGKLCSVTFIIHKDLNYELNVSCFSFAYSYLFVFIFFLILFSTISVSLLLSLIE